MQKVKEEIWTTMSRIRLATHYRNRVDSHAAMKIEPSLSFDLLRQQVAAERHAAIEATAAKYVHRPRSFSAHACNGRRQPGQPMSRSR